MYPLSSPPRKSGKRGRNATEVVLPSTTYRFRFQRSSDQSDGVVEHSLAWDVSNSVEWNAIRLRLDADDGARLELFLLQEVIPLLRTKVQQQLEKENVRNPTVAEQAPDTSAPVKKRRVLSSSATLTAAGPSSPAVPPTSSLLVDRVNIGDDRLHIDSE